MFKNLRLCRNIMLGMGVAITLAVAALTYGSLRNMEAVIGESERVELRQISMRFRQRGGGNPSGGGNEHSDRQYPGGAGPIRRWRPGRTANTIVALL